MHIPTFPIPFAYFISLSVYLFYPITFLVSHPVCIISLVPADSVVSVRLYIFWCLTGDMKARYLLYFPYNVAALPTDLCLIILLRKYRTNGKICCIQKERILLYNKDLPIGRSIESSSWFLPFARPSIVNSLRTSIMETNMNRTR